MYICRICLDPNIARDMKELPLHIKDEALCFKEVIFFCLSIQVTEDSIIYRKLCAKCFDSLVYFYTFKSVALKNNEYIQNCHTKSEEGLYTVKVEIDDEEYDHHNATESMITDPVSEDDSHLAAKIPKKEVQTDSQKRQPKLQRGKAKKQPSSPKTDDKTEIQDPTLIACSVCGDSVNDLPTHLLTHDSVQTEQSLGTSPCSTCGDVFPTRHQMLRHVRLKHAAKIKCAECAQSASCLTDHMRVNHDKVLPKSACSHCRIGAKTRSGPNQCSLCPKSFRKKHRLDAHVQRYHTEKKLLQCQYCPEKFRAYCSLHKHEATHTITEDDTMRKKNTKDTAESESSTTRTLIDSTSCSIGGPSYDGSKPKKMFKCVECGEEFASRTMMYRHREPKGKRQCDICFKFYGYASLSTHKRIVHEKESLPFGCAHCGRRFLQLSKLADHERTHTKERPFACPHCDKNFTQEIALKNHVQNVHEKRRSFICQHCCMGFFQKHNLEKHILRRHSSDLPHQCLECGMRFKIIDALKDHASKHTGARPHQCPLCSLAFRQRGGLRSHLRTHSSEQPFACRYCGARFKRGDYRRNHEKKAHPEEFADRERTKRVLE